MNPSVYFGSKTDENPQEFVEFYKILSAIGVSGDEKGKFAAYQLKVMALTWYRMWRDGRAQGEVLVTWDILKTTFLKWFFPRKQREAKVEELINLR